MIRVVDALDAHCQASGLGRFFAAAAETGVMDGTSATWKAAGNDCLKEE
jgi:hypothetical protein